MVCRQFRSAEVQEEKAYTRGMIGGGRVFKERQREWVICPKCWKEVAKGALVVHRQTQHGVAKCRLGQEGNEEAGRDDPRTYRMAFPAKSRHRPFPVEGCSGQVIILTSIRVHLWNQNFRETMVIM